MNNSAYGYYIKYKHDYRQTWIPTLKHTTRQTNRRDAITKYDDVIKWKHFPRYWPFVWGIHRSPVKSPHKDQWRGALTFSLICAWVNGWVNYRDAGELRRHCAHCDVTFMKIWRQTWRQTPRIFCCISQELYIDGLAQDCSNSSASAVESLQSCAKPSICTCLRRHRAIQRHVGRLGLVYWNKVNHMNEITNTLNFAHPMYPLFVSPILGKEPCKYKSKSSVSFQWRHISF